MAAWFLAEPVSALQMAGAALVLAGVMLVSANGKGSVSTFGGHAWDAGQVLKAAIPVALKGGQPGTPQFRNALRDALEGVKEVPGAHGIFNMSASDHLGLDQRARVMVKIENGRWKYQEVK